MGFSIQRSSRQFNRISAGCLLGALLILGGCAHSQSISANAIQVEGVITVRGNVPFNEAVLITDDNNWYVLDLTENQEAELQTPAQARITGTVRLDFWDGRPMAFLAVQEWTFATN